MIRKFLIVAKTVFLSPAKMDEEGGSVYNIDLYMPLAVNWRIQGMLDAANYLLASHGQIADIHEIYRDIFKTAAPYAMVENDRLWLLKRSQTSPSAPAAGTS